MKTHLVRWDEEYRKRGLVIINVNNGQMDDFDRLRSVVADARIRYPVGWDENARTCKDYGVRGYAASFLIGTNGKVVWEGFPLARPIGEREELVKKELSKVTEDELSKIRAEMGG